MIKSFFKFLFSWKGFIATFVIIYFSGMTYLLQPKWLDNFKPAETIRNEISIDLYAEEDRKLDDTELRLMKEWSKGVNNFCSPSVIEWFWEKYQYAPKVKAFMIAATKSSNGFDDNDCVSLSHLTTEEDDRIKLEEKRTELKKIESQIREESKKK